MWTVIGIILIIYAIIAIVILFVLRKDLITLWDRQVIKVQQVIGKGRDLLRPVAAAAAATRSGGGHVEDAANHIDRTVPPALQSAANSLDGVATALQDLPRHVDDFVRDASAGLNNSLAAITDSITLLTTDTIPSAKKALIDLSRDLDQPPFWLTQDALTALENDDHVPTAVAAKLIPLVAQRYEGEAEFRTALSGVLTAAEVASYADLAVGPGDIVNCCGC